MMNKLSEFPVKSRWYAAASLAALLILGFWGPYQSHRESLRLDGDIENLEVAIKEQSLFHKAYEPMRRMLEQPEVTAPPPIDKAPLDVDETTRIGVTLSRMAEDAGLKPLAIHPDVSSLMGSRGEMLVDARVAGAFRGLRTFVREVGMLPGLKEFVFLEIREIPQDREMHLKARFLTKE